MSALKTSLKYAVPLLVFVLLSLFLLRGLYMDPQELPTALKDKPLPAFALPSLQEPQRIVQHSELLGTPFLINVFATWCPTCYVEHPYLHKLAREKGVRIVGLNYKDDAEKAKAYLARLGNPYETVLFDAKGRAGIELGIYGAPETFLVSADGRILHRRAGEMSEQSWEREFAPLLERAR
jgi:cytochrome c biogenesis protein CcmG/thiol:disulfide interchange protein DsbE